MHKITSNSFLLIIMVLTYISLGLVTSVVGVIIDKFQVKYNVTLKIAAYSFLHFISLNYNQLL